MERQKKKSRRPEAHGREHRPRAAAPTLGTHNASTSAIGPGGGADSVAEARFFRPSDWLAAAALVAAVFLVYQPCWGGRFLWDDDLHLLNNPVLKPGGLAKAWVPGSYINYWPLTFTAYWLQFRLWGLNPLGFHLVNLALHALSALLVWQVLLRLRVPGALFAAAIFALHPVNVEGVAWIAQLKGILSLLFALLSMLFYLDHERLGSRWRYRAAIAAFLLSALAKGTAVTLPAVLLACAWWQRGRIQRRDALRVLPYVLIGAVMAGVEVWTQHQVAQGEIVRADGFFSRAAVAGCAAWFYLGKLIWPVDLCLVYPRWTIDGRSLLSYLPGALLAVLLLWAWRRRRTWGRPAVMLIVCYVGLLLPALGFVNIYFMKYSLAADHWQYAAMIVPCAVFAGVAVTLARGNRWGRPAAYCMCGIPLLILATLSWRQSRMYTDGETLFRTTIARNPGSSMAHTNLGLALDDQGKVDEAVAHYRKALEISPDNPEAHNNLGLALAGRGQVDDAVAHYQKALKIKPGYASAHYNFANLLARCGQVDEALAHYRKAVEIRPDNAEAHYSLGLALAGCGRVDEAIVEYRTALEIQPADASVHYDLGAALAGCGQVDEAIVHYRKALEIKPGDAMAHNNLGNALARRGQVDEAITHYQRALELKPDYTKAHNNLGNALAGRGEFDGAVAHYRKALEISPDNANARRNLAMALSERERILNTLAQRREALRVRPADAALLAETAWMLATDPNASVRDGNEAVGLAQRALRLSDGRAPAVLDTLAAAYAEVSRFPEAVPLAEEAARLASAAGDHALAEKIRGHAALYRSGRPYRQTPGR